MYRTDCQVLVSDYVLNSQHPVKQCYEWQKSNMSMRSWTTELKEELYSTGLAFVWRKQRERNLREITTMVKERCNDTERQNTFAENLRTAREHYI